MKSRYLRIEIIFFDPVKSSELPWPITKNPIKHVFTLDHTRPPVSVLLYGLQQSSKIFLHLESIQRTFIFQIEGMAKLNYRERLKFLNLMSIQRCHEWFKIIHLWKIYAGIVLNYIGIRFYRTDCLGVRCHIAKIKTTVSSIKTLVYNFFSNMGPLLFNSIYSIKYQRCRKCK